MMETCHASRHLVCHVLLKSVCVCVSKSVSKTHNQQVVLSKRQAGKSYQSACDFSQQGDGGGI